MSSAVTFLTPSLVVANAPALLQYAIWLLGDSAQAALEVHMGSAAESLKARAAAAADAAKSEIKKLQLLLPCPDWSDPEVCCVVSHRESSDHGVCVIIPLIHT